MMCDEVLVVQEWLRSWLPAGSCRSCDRDSVCESWVIERSSGRLPHIAVHFFGDGVAVESGDGPWVAGPRRVVLPPLPRFEYADPEFFEKLQTRIKELLG